MLVAAVGQVAYGGVGAGLLTFTYRVAAGAAWMENRRRNGRYLFMVLAEHIAFLLG
jgi:hypothetical protein